MSPESSLVVDEHAIARGTFYLSGKLVSVGHSRYLWDEPTETRVIADLIASGELGVGVELLNQLRIYLRDTDFYLHRNQILYRAICEIALRAEQFDVQSILNQLKSVPEGLQVVGGEMELYRLANTVPLNTETHARQLVRYSLQRSLMAAGNYLIKTTQAANLPLETTLLEMQAQLQQIGTRISLLDGNNVYELNQTLPQYLEKITLEAQNPLHETGIKIWLTSLQHALLGWRKNKLYLFAAGTGMGKTMLLLNIALQALRQHKRVLFFTLEMKAEELLDRILAIETSISGLQIQSRTLSGQELEAAEMVISNLATYQSNLYVVEMNNPTMSEIRAKLDTFKLSTGFDLVCIDYIGTEMIAFPGNYEVDPNRHGNHLWTEMRQIKMDYDAPFIVGAQVNRAYMGRESKRPQKTDIANSSKAENAADVLAIFHRMSVVEEGGMINQADITIEKNRSGPGGISQMFDVYFDEQTGKIRDWPQKSYL